MKSKTLALLYADLGVTKSHSRPYVSNDNPFSEAQFKTLKYRPEFPDRFGAIEDARGFCGTFLPWYNVEHHHSGLGLLTPHDVHYGLASEVRQRRSIVLAAAHQAHPERFVHGVPTPAPLPTAVWINKPSVVPPGAQPATAASVDGGFAVGNGLPLSTVKGGAVPVDVGTEEVEL
jgi:putative transposase